MLIQINTGHNIEGDEARAVEVEAAVRSRLDRFSEHITRVEVHVSDETSSEKVGINSKRCMLEARLEGRQPVAVSDQAATVAQAVGGAADKMKHMLVSTLGRLEDR